MDPDATMREIMRHLYEVDGDLDECLEAIGSLADWINGGGFAPREEGTGLSWSDVLTGAWWYCVNWHDGQSSLAYEVSYRIGRVYKAGRIATGPEPDSGEEDIYDSLVLLGGHEAKV